MVRVVGKEGRGGNCNGGMDGSGKAMRLYPVR